MLFCVVCAFCLLVVLVRLSVPVQVTDWNDSSMKWPTVYNASTGTLNPTHSLTMCPYTVTARLMKLIMSNSTNRLLETPQTSASHSSWRMYRAPQSLAVAAFSDPAESVSTSSAGSSSVAVLLAAAPPPPPPRHTDTRSDVDGDDARTPIALPVGRSPKQREDDQTTPQARRRFARRGCKQKTYTTHACSRSYRTLSAGRILQQQPADFRTPNIAFFGPDQKCRNSRRHQVYDIQVRRRRRLR